MGKTSLRTFTRSMLTPPTTTATPYHRNGTWGPKKKNGSPGRRRADNNNIVFDKCPVKGATQQLFAGGRWRHAAVLPTEDELRDLLPAGGCGRTEPGPARPATGNYPSARGKTKTRPLVHHGAFHHGAAHHYGGLRHSGHVSRHARRCPASARGEPRATTLPLWLPGLMASVEHRYSVGALRFFFAVECICCSNGRPPHRRSKPILPTITKVHTTETALHFSNCGTEIKNKPLRQKTKFPPWPNPREGRALHRGRLSQVWGDQLDGCPRSGGISSADPPRPGTAVRACVAWRATTNI